MKKLINAHKRVDILHELRCMYNDPDSHGDGEPKPSSKEHGAWWLGNAELIHHSVTNPAQEEGTEETRGPPGVGIGQHVHDTDQ